MLLTGFSDLFYTVDEGRRGVGVATFQYLSPSLLVITMVSTVGAISGGEGGGQVTIKGIM